MENVYRQFIDSAPIKVDLDFGVNNNVVLRSVSIEPRMHQGTLIKRNTFMTFTQVNPVTRKALKEHEYSFFNLNNDSDWVEDNLNAKITKLVSICTSLGLDADLFATQVNIALNKHGVSEKDDLSELVQTVRGAANVDNGLSEGFYNTIKDSVGLDGELVHFKTTIDKRGYLEIPMYNSFIENVSENPDSTLVVTVKEITMKNKALETKSVGADKLGKAPKLGGGSLGMKLKGF